jgi:hypothetical protein
VNQDLTPEEVDLVTGGSVTNCKGVLSLFPPKVDGVVCGDAL